MRGSHRLCESASTVYADRYAALLQTWRCFVVKLIHPRELTAQVNVLQLAPLLSVLSNDTRAHKKENYIAPNLVCGSATSSSQTNWLNSWTLHTSS